VGRVESSWRPATAEEGFEIVRRRLFEPLAGPDAFKQRDVTARAFADLYHAQSAEFPPECRGGDYEKRIQAAYPIHPEIFDRLYTDWSTLVKFQRTRGVLRLMPAVFGDALRRLAAAATYLYQDGSRFWYATQPTVTKLAEDRAEQLNRDPIPDKVAQELDERLRADLRKNGDFSRIHPLPRSGADVPDDLDARLVVLSPDHSYGTEPGNAAAA